MTIWKLLREALFLLLLFPLVAIIMHLTLNYFGFCFETYKRLSDEEKITIALRNTQAHYRSTLYGGTRELSNATTPPFPYKDIAHFRQANPDCCRITNVQERLGYQITLGDRLWGSISSFVEVKYQTFYLDANNQRASKTVTEFVAISNCGHPWSGI
ncbi:hypothetical protein BIY26_11220 [Brenneria goodwinii]|uniref:Uncharacterized protein n=1 Tax=Brenneria goodwinii TaxID=1109412 RepID=A0A0G4JTW7_9GAMM|nr:hypothetical protein [Brenneria goodwinii]ATA25954.1 hypothetical protein AWC36_18560 [Brenneria goodwinii]MCG8157336.1 hypothetical protein [Brenneria goodwinii]MCG8163341.1 hypothetical protein [Brenneria goodwinii]MCG8165150.1 hypothetical protein [Brenneria goodwinii]MCG8170882.1 hypothetical protein [Brenneria goodwinii]